MKVIHYTPNMLTCLSLEVFEQVDRIRVNTRGYELRQNKIKTTSFVTDEPFELWIEEDVKPTEEIE
jgi:hypothetical protein